MEAVLIISLCLICIGTSILIATQRKKEMYLDLRIATWVITLAIAFFGVFLLPLLGTDHEHIKEIKNYSIIKSENAIVIDLANSGLSSGFSYIDELKKFNTYNAITNFSDSTKYFIVYKKSFYNLTIDKYIVWSNPPYANFKKE